jgi:hypothetical protein
MAKSRKNMCKRKTRKVRRRNSKKSMKGGAYTPEQMQQLLDQGFTRDFLHMAEPVIGFDVLLTDFQGSNKPVQQYMNETYDAFGINPDDGFTDTEDNDDDDQDGGKRKTKRHKNRNRKSHRNKKGGALFGRGYGANCNDPNYNVYNTNMLKLFPYSAK